MINRTNTRTIKVGNIEIGGNNNVIIQSMCNTKTKNIATLNEWSLKIGSLTLNLSVWLGWPRKRKKL